MRLKELRNICRITQSKLAEKIGVSRSTIAMYETGSSEPDIDTLNKIADFFKVSLDFLMERGDASIKPSGIKIPVLGAIPAGIPIDAIEDVIDYEEITEDMAKTGTFFGLKVQGDSMIPTINAGDTLIIRQQNDAENGKICVVMVNGYAATLKAIKKEANGLWLMPHNPNSDFKPTFYTNKEVEELPVRILGVAVEIRRSL